MSLADVFYKKKKKIEERKEGRVKGEREGEGGGGGEGGGEGRKGGREEGRKERSKKEKMEKVRKKRGKGGEGETILKNTTSYKMASTDKVGGALWVSLTTGDKRINFKLFYLSQTPLLKVHHSPSTPQAVARICLVNSPHPHLSVPTELR